jgi:hypothetical protein
LPNFLTGRASLHVERQLCALLLFHPLRLLELAELTRHLGAGAMRGDTSTWTGQVVTTPDDNTRSQACMVRVWGIWGLWWPAEEEEESLLFKGVLNIFFSSTYPP